jgi:hypothetical protein
MKRSKTLGLAMMAIVALAVAPACMCGWLIPYPPADPECLEAPYSNPPATFQDPDLVGTWETCYEEWQVDRLILKADGTFRQIYEERIAYVVRQYVYETPWNEWWLERFPDGRVRVHLKGARYYIDGISTAELDGLRFPCPTTQPGCTGEPRLPPHNFYDPFAREYVHMAGELVLNARVDSAGELLLHHMSYDSEGSFAISGCQRRHFRRVETP